MTDDIPRLEHVCAPLEVYCQPANLDPALALGRAKILQDVEHAIWVKKTGKRPAPGASAALYFAAWMRSKRSMDFMTLSESGYALSCEDYRATVKHLVESESGIYIVDLRIEEPSPAGAVITVGMAALMRKKFLRPYKRATLVLKADGSSTWIEYNADLADQAALDALIGLGRWLDRSRTAWGAF